MPLSGVIYIRKQRGFQHHELESDSDLESSEDSAEVDNDLPPLGELSSDDEEEEEKAKASLTSSKLKGN